MNSDTKNSGWAGEVLGGVLQAQPATPQGSINAGTLLRRGLAVTLSGLMLMVPMGQSAFAQESYYPPLEEQQQQQAAQPVYDNSQPAQPNYDTNSVPQGQPLSADQLDQLVAPIALYPDALVAQVLVSATYPTQIVEADRWRQAQGNAPAEQIAASADSYDWDPSVKALTAFPTVLAQLDRNLQWTTDLGNAYYNQPQDVMDSIQEMRQKAQSAGQLRSTQQQVVTNDGGSIQIVPANPSVVYVPVYNPWVVYGSPFPMYPGYYYYPPPGAYFGSGLAIGFCAGVGIGFFSHWGWGWNHWGLGWHDRSVYFNRARYFTHSRTVINRGFYRAGGPGRYYGARGAYARGDYRHGYSRPGDYRHAGDYRRAGDYRQRDYRYGDHRPNDYRRPDVHRPGEYRPNDGHRSGDNYKPGNYGHKPDYRVDKDYGNRPGNTGKNAGYRVDTYGNRPGSGKNPGYRVDANYGRPANVGRPAVGYKGYPANADVGHSQGQGYRPHVVNQPVPRRPGNDYGHSSASMRPYSGGHSSASMSMGHSSAGMSRPPSMPHGGGHPSGGNYGGGGHSSSGHSGGGSHGGGGGSHSGGGHDGHKR